MSTNHTPNYNLCQWEATDKVLRSDFNQDNAKIDAALAGLQSSALRIHTGSYKGDGHSSKLIELPFRPVFFRLQQAGVNPDYVVLYGDLNAIQVTYSGEKPRAYFNGFWSRITWEGNGLKLYVDSSNANESNERAMNSKTGTYYYVAIG